VGAQIIFPESGRGLGHVIATIFGSTVGYPSDSLASCLHTYLYEHFYTRLQIFIQLSPTLTKLCHTKRDHPMNFYISLEVELVSLLAEQMTSLLTSCHIPHVC